MQDLVTIIIPVYNGEQFLQRAIDSCLNQDYSNFELLIIDNCSTDNTKIIGEQNEKQDNRIKYIYTDIKGVSNARNIGLDKAQGKYIQFLDADDELIHDKLISAMQKFSQNLDIDAVSAGVQIIKNQKKIKKIYSQNLFPDSLLALNLFMVSQPLFKVELSSRFSDGQKYIEDWEYWINTLYNKNVVHEDEYIGCNVHVHDYNASQDVFKMYEGGLQVSLKTKQLFRKRNFRVRMYDFIYLLIYAYNPNKTKETDALIAKYARKSFKTAIFITKIPILNRIVYIPFKKRIEKNVYL